MKRRTSTTVACAVAGRDAKGFCTWGLVGELFWDKQRIATWDGRVIAYAEAEIDFVARLARRYFRATGKLPNLCAHWTQWGRNCMPRSR